jgi:hypothetical protein
LTTKDNLGKLVLIGGQPKGYLKPFDEKTHSGKILHSILRRQKLNPILLDLWETPEQERLGFIPEQKIREIIAYRLTCKARIIALGHWVHTCLSKYDINVEYLPHPASRKESDLIRLELGLITLQKEGNSK